MRIREGTPLEQAEARRSALEVGDDADVYRPRKLTLAENAVLTVKVLAGFGLFGALLWGVKLWTSGSR